MSPTPRAGRPAADLALAAILEPALSQAVRTPLHSLLGFLELLAMTGLDDDQRRLHRRLVDSADELLQGGDRLLWLVRLLGERYRPRPARVHLAAFAAEVAAASDGVVSAVVAPDAPAHVDSDLAALHQLVLELVANATAHGAAPVVLAVSPVGDGRPGVRITVSDGGAGLPSGPRRALVETVAGVDPGSIDPGAGLGLVLVRRLATLLEGAVQVLPSATGTHVALTLPPVLTGGQALPAAQPTGSLIPASAATPATGQTAAPGRPLRVLLVEDNATNRLLTERQLARLGHSLTSVASGAAGVAAVLDSPEGEAIDVVLMDRHLPDIDGCEATRRIRAGLPSGRGHLPILAVTADATAEAHDACTAAGMDEVLTKPVDLEQLGRALDRAAATADPGATGSGGTGRLSTGDQADPAFLDAAARRMGGDTEAAEELLQAYLSELPGRRLRIQAALRRGEPRVVQAAAESLRTSSDAIGATAVAGTCAAMASAAAAGDLVSARSFLPGLASRCEHLAAELGGFLRRRHAGLAAH